jgi:hypothetical protein
MLFITTLFLALFITTQVQCAAPYQKPPVQVVMDTIATDVETICACCGAIIENCTHLADRGCREIEAVCCGEDMHPCQRLAGRITAGALCVPCCASLLQDCSNYHCQHCLNNACPALAGIAQCACATYCCCRFCIKPGIRERIGKCCHKLGDWCDGHDD